MTTSELPEYALVIAITPDYLSKAHMTLPTFTYKPQLRDKHLYVFHRGFSCNKCKLNWIKKYYPNSTFIEWELSGCKDKREIMLSSFVLGVAEHVTEEWSLKIDLDTYCYNDDDILDEEDFKYDLVAKNWGYTKPRWFHLAMKDFVEGRNYIGEKVQGTFSANRITSWCCLQKTDFVKFCAKAAKKRCDGRLPIPSHDSYLWFMADFFEDCTWKAKNFKKHGMDHQRSFRKIREAICARSPWNPYLNKILFDHIQLHVSDACTMACPNCDRGCELLPTPGMMTVEQVKKFVDESIEMHHKWDRIDLIGGEPTINPDIYKIIEEVDRYRQTVYKRCKIRLSSNGKTKKTQEVLAKIEKDYSFVSIRNSAKETKGVPDFEYVHMAPIDNEAEFKKKGLQSCSIPYRCGLGLSRYGYGLCGAGTSVCRIFGLDILAKSLKDLTIDKLKEQREQLCKFCGHSQTCLEKGKEKKVSKSWKSSVKHAAKNEARMTLY